MSKASKKRQAASMEEEKQPEVMMTNVGISQDESKSFFSNLQSMYRNEQFCDVTFKVGSKEFKAHSCSVF